MSARRVGLTGGVASGKSAAAARFAALGVPVLDADLAARAVVEPGEPALDEIVRAFGTGLLDATGALDRAELRRRVFADPGARARLEAIVHPRVKDWLRARAEAVDAPYVLVVIPLLVETGPYPWLEHVVVVDADEATQLARLRARDGIDDTLAEAMLAAQAGRQQRLACADEVLRNDGSLADLHAQVDALHARLLHRFAAAPPR